MAAIWIQMGELMEKIGLLEFLPPLFAAMVYGGIIGIEREMHQKPAGLRTNMLICMGAAVFTMIAKHISTNPDSETRVIQGIITGVGFLGAGVLMHQQGNVQGLTTAATTWLVTGVGIACGARLYALAASAVILAIVILMGLYPLEQKLHRNGTNGNHNSIQDKDLGASQ